MSASASAPEILDWGLVPYDEALARQMARTDDRRAGRVGDALIFCEHPSLYTLGSRPGAEKNLLLSESELAGRGVGLHRVSRGGDITAHNPGQVVGYAIVDLEGRGRDLHAFLRDLEEVLLNTLRALGLDADRRPGKTGVWVGGNTRKIAAIGVAARSWVTYHGFALNANNDLAIFRDIVPCGISSDEGAVTSLAAELGRPVDLVGLKALLAAEFLKVFGRG
jgi:lipoyl(octanoyl) transferase